MNTDVCTETFGSPSSIDKCLDVYTWHLCQGSSSTSNVKLILMGIKFGVKVCVSALIQTYKIALNLIN